MADAAQLQDTQKRIDALSDRQALKTLDVLGRQFVEAVTPTEEVSALNALLQEAGKPLQAADDSKAGLKARGEAAREILKMLAELPETKAALRHQLDAPGSEELGTVPLILAAPVVLTGCLVVLQLAGHIEFSRSEEGKWSVKYDPSKSTPFDKTVSSMVGVLADLMKKLGVGG